MTRIFNRTRMAGGGLFAVCSLGISSFAAASPGEPNVLYFGNSFTHFYSWGNYIDQSVDAITIAAGRTHGQTVRQSVGGASLETHLNATGEASIAHLATSLPEGQTWDFVVIQGQSTEATVELGDPAAFNANAKAIYSQVAASNPGVKAILYETWARNPNTTETIYPTPFASPTVMQAQIRTAYQGVVRDLNTQPGAARYAGVGDAFESQGWPDAYYKPDYFHASDRGGLLASLTIYGAMYGPNTHALAVTGALDNVAATAGLTHDDVVALSAVADAAGAKRGDADMDLDVDFIDLLTLARHYQAPGPQTWFTGDFDASNSVDFNDLLSLAKHYGNAASFDADWSLAQSMTPEPTMALVLVSTTLRRRR